MQILAYVLLVLSCFIFAANVACSLGLPSVGERLQHFLGSLFNLAMITFFSLYLFGG